MGHSHRAYDPLIDRHVALKVLYKTLTGHEDLVTSLAQEARKLAFISWKLNSDKKRVVEIYNFNRFGVRSFDGKKREVL